MPEEPPPRLATQITLIAAAGAAVLAFTRAYGSWADWLILAPVLVSPFWRMRHVPERIKTALPVAARVALFLTVMFGIAWSIYPVLPAALVARGPRLAGHLLVGFLTMFVLGSAIWPPGATAIPVALGLLVVAALEKQSTPAFVPVLLAAAALVAYAAASNRTVRPSRPGAGRRARAAAALAYLLAACALSAAIVGFLPWAQPFVEGSVVRALNPYMQHGGFSDNTSLGSIEQLALSRRVVMRVWTDQPQKLRARAYTRFHGRGWQASPSEAGLPLRAGISAPTDLGAWLSAIPGRDFLVPGQSIEDAADRQAIRTRIVQGELEGALVAPGASVLVRLAHPEPRVDRFGVLKPVYPVPRLYGVINRGVVAQLGQRAPALSEPERAEALALPPDLDSRLRSLADRLSSEGRDDADRVQRTLGYLSTNCRYSLKVGAFHSSQPVAEFLFEKKRGYCEYFASAAAVLLRLQGIPTRYVAGFNVTDDNYRAGHYVVRESDAHAWVEVALPGAGWREADPTPAAQYAELHPPSSRNVFAEVAEWLRAKWAELSARLAGGDPIGLLRWAVRKSWAAVRQRPLAAIVIALLAILWTARKGLARLATRRGPPSRPAVDSGSVPRELAALLARLDEELARAGCARAESSAPLEHIERLPPDRLSSEMRTAARQIVECFYQARFGGAEFADARIRELDEAFRSAKAQPITRAPGP